MISLIIALVVLGIIFYLVEMIPMAAPFPTLVRVVAIIIAVVLILQFLGIDVGGSLSRFN